MSKVLRFCPNCGSELKGARLCPVCGYDSRKEVYSAPSKKTAKSESSSKEETNKGKTNALWDLVGPYMPELGKYQWIICLVLCGIVLLVYLLGGIPYMIGGTYDAYFKKWIWERLISVLIEIGLILLWLKPKFSERLQKAQYKTLLSESVQIGVIRIPIIMIMGIVITFFAWSVAIFFVILVLFPAIIIIFWGPIPFEWNVEQTVKGHKQSLI